MKDMKRESDTAAIEISTPDQQRTRGDSGTPPPAGAAAASATAKTATTPPSQQKAKRKRGQLAAVGRSVVKGPRMLGRRIKHFLQDDMHVGANFKKMPVTTASRELATMELLAVYHRWLRGVQALLAILVFLLSFMSVPSAATLVNWTIFIISQLTILVICKTYEVKAQFSGVTNVLFAGRNIFTSPFFFEMVAEIILWNIQTPPIVIFFKTFFNLINYFIFLRLYSVILYLNNAAYVYRTFCRAMSAISDLPLSTSFLVRTSLVNHRYRVGTIFFLTAWLTVGFMYAKAEAVPASTGLWFAFQTLTTLGYGDATPVTVAGRAVVMIAGVCTFFLLAYLIVCAQATLLATDAEYNMQVLARCHDLTQSLRNRSAWVIQIAWKFHRMRKQADLAPTKKAKLKVIIVSAGLTHVIAALRRTRQNLRAAQRDFRETNVNPLTGLSSYQYTTYVYETHKSARRLQQVKDVDRVYLALKDRDVPASSLTRADIASILMPNGTHTLEDDARLFSGDVHAAQLRRRQSMTLSMSLESVGQGGATTAGAEPVSPFTASTSGVETKQREEQRIAGLEARVEQLTVLLEALAASTGTHPPSMTVSQV